MRIWSTSPRSARADTEESYKPLQTASLKTVAALLNSREGGALLIGVADDGSVFGLDSDYATLRKPGKDDRDLFGLHLNQALINSVGMAAAANVSQQILEVGGKDLYHIHVKPSSFPVDAEVDKNGQHVKKRLFYGRFGNGTRAISDTTERERYKVQVWGFRSPRFSDGRLDGAEPAPTGPQRRPPRGGQGRRVYQAVHLTFAKPLG